MSRGKTGEDQALGAQKKLFILSFYNSKKAFMLAKKFTYVIKKKAQHIVFALGLTYSLSVLYVPI